MVELLEVKRSIVSYEEEDARAEKLVVKVIGLGYGQPSSSGKRALRPKYTFSRSAAWTAYPRLTNTCLAAGQSSSAFARQRKASRDTSRLLFLNPCWASISIPCFCTPYTQQNPSCSTSDMLRTSWAKMESASLASRPSTLSRCRALSLPAIAYEQKLLVPGYSESTLLYRSILGFSCG